MGLSDEPILLKPRQCPLMRNFQAWEAGESFRSGSELLGWKAHSLREKPIQFTMRFISSQR